MKDKGGFEYINHTADAGLTAWGVSPAELFKQATLGLLNMMLELDKVRISGEKELTVMGKGYEELIVRWLSEIKDTVEWDGFAVKDILIAKLTEKHLEGKLLGEPFDPKRHEIVTEVKRVTYHNLEVSRDEQGIWRTTIIFDL